MSSKISQVYYLTEYSFGRTIQTWPKLLYRATSAKDANTLGFRDREMTKNPRCARVVNRPTGIHPASRTAKRQSGRNKKRLEAVTSSHFAKKLLRQDDTRRSSFTSRAVTLTVNNMGISSGYCLGGNPNHLLLLGRGVY